MARRNNSPLDVTLSEEQERDFATWLCQAVTDAQAARQSIVGDDGAIDYWHALYEQGSSKIAKDSPWKGAADLTSYIGTEKIDALRSRMMKTIFAEPIWVVEGSGRSSKNAPYVEEFHQWAAEKSERLQGRLGRGVHNALVEGVGVLYTTERTDRVLRRQVKTVAAQTNELGGVVLDEQNQPIPVMGQDGNFADAELGQPAVDTVVEWSELRSKGPRTRIVSIKDFVQLPGHATDRDDVFAYGHKFYRRLPELRQLAKQGIYRADAVNAIGTAPERDAKPRELALGQDVAPQIGASVEKELWQLEVLYDFDGKGERWYLITLSVPHRQILRIKLDDLGRSRYTLLIPSPMPNSVWGYSQIGHKLGTIIEEHTALRNMIADRSALAVNAPMKRLQGALWDPSDQPFGPNQVIDVRSMDEVQSMQIPDVPISQFNQRTHVEQASERIVGVADIAAGVTSTEKRTATEQSLVASASAVRIDEAIANMQEPLEELAELRNDLWINALKAQESGMEVPDSVASNLSARGLALENNRITADLLTGNFRFKPRNSVETADPMRLRQDFNGFMGAVGGLAQNVPVLGAWMSDPKRIRALFAEMCRLYRVQNRQDILGTQQEWDQFNAQQQAQQAQAAQMQQMQAVMASGQPTANGGPGMTGPMRNMPPLPQQGMPPELAALMMAGAQA